MAKVLQKGFRRKLRRSADQPRAASVSPAAAALAKPALSPDARKYFAAAHPTFKRNPERFFERG